MRTHIAMIATIIYGELVRYPLNIHILKLKQDFSYLNDEKFVTAVEWWCFSMHMLLDKDTKCLHICY